MATKLTAPTAKHIKLDAVHPNVGIEKAYQKGMQDLVTEMSKSYVYWLRAEWRKSPPMAGLAQDAEIKDLKNIMSRLGKHWQKRFDDLAPKLAKIFINGATQHTDKAMMASLSKAGFAVKFQLTPAAKEGFEAVLAENVALIKTISQEHFKAIEGHVWRAVAGGYDMQTLTNSLQESYGVTHRRAAFIARDQANKVAAVIERVRRKELGITQAIWQHSGGGHEPRPSHVAASGKLFDAEKGMLLDGEYIQPHSIFNCRCTSRSVIVGFED